MTKQETYKIVYEDIMKNVPIYNGNHFESANPDFICGIKSLMEYIEYKGKRSKKKYELFYC